AAFFLTMRFGSQLNTSNGLSPIPSFSRSSCTTHPAQQYPPIYSRRWGYLGFAWRNGGVCDDGEGAHPFSHVAKLQFAAYFSINEKARALRESTLCNRSGSYQFDRKSRVCARARQWLSSKELSLPSFRR